MEKIVNEKVFFRVFPTLKVEDDIQMLFDDVEVQKITTNSKHDFLHIYIFSRHLIQKKHIWQMEQKIRDQLFKGQGINIRLEEQYALSEQYTPSTLMMEYHDSIVQELKQHSVLASNMFEQAKMDFEGADILYLEMPDTIVSEGKKEHIVNLLHEIFEKRFHMKADIRVTYRESEGGKDREYDEQRVRQEVRAIFERRARQRGEEYSEDGAAQKGEQKKDGSSEQKGNSERKGDFQKKNFKKKDFYRPLKQGDDPSLIYGKNFEDEPIKLDQVVGEMGEITIHGKIINFDTREIRNEKTILMFAVTDFTDTITIKMFARNDQLPELLGELKKGIFVKIKGITTIDKFDGELTIGSVTGIKKSGDFTVSRDDLSPRKRVELHCHTKMSDMDGASEVKDIVKRAHDWGHPAIAITDHGVVQSFPDANHYIHTLDKDDPFKILYGVEGYIVDDLTDIAVNAGDENLDGTYIVFDLETTGFSSIKDKIIEIGAVKVVNGEVVDRFSTFVNPKRPIPFEITQLTGITDEMVIESPDIETILPQFLEFAGDGVLVAHNAGFDVGFIEQNCRYQEIVPNFVYVDTVALARVLLPTLSRYKLNVVAKALGIPLENHHRAVDDAKATAEIFMKFVQMLREQNINTLKEVNQFGDMNPNAIRKLPTYHVIILIQNDIGRFNLYQLISQSHLTYYNRRPRIPKSVLNRHREGLIVGSACEAGELYQAILNKRSSEFIARLADFYDYYEIQPVGNNWFMVESEKYPDINSVEDLQEINREIVELGEKFKKPVVGTCDVHFLDPGDEVYRRIIMAGKGFSDADSQPPLYLRTTEEMLEEFEYLGSAKARDVVIENPNKICDMIEKISPINPNKCPPVIENSEQDLRDICYNKAHELYGPDLPKPVFERLERELNSIISNGYSVMYIIAQKLVWKSNEDGYLVGSRGSVGSSFVATMAGITEVNPLSPHYYCKKCHYNDFDSDEVKAFAGGCGFDMPDKTCPVCGEQLVKDGFDIPFETFLGFKGDKEPDIDLNFSGDYQAKAHKYTEIIFGEGHTFKAGTIGTLADKTAFGYVKNYYEERGHRKRKCEIDRITVGCTGIRRSTGQHPGGIVVLPHGHDINEFTPVQHPANDMTTDIITTHFDYHSIDHNLLKLDILGHDDPTMIRTLEEYITSDAMDNEYNEANPFIATKIPLDDKKVLSLFHDTSALKIKPEDIDGCKLGCLGIPEFGTEFVIQMVQDAKPQSLSDLIRISGLSHGTNVWLGNAQELVKSGKATISTCICTRDDIMVYLINQGVDSALSFTIMESVRKGKGLKPEWETAMKEKDVPDWYIWSCKQISYMFPKAHAAAYVMMAYRIAYCKVNYPLAYYGAYFGIRANAFSYEIMCQGKEKLDYYMKDYKRRADSLSNKEQDVLKDMRIVQEMYARGFEFLPLDIYKAKAAKFQIIDGKLMPPLSSIEGMGEKAAEAVEEASKNGAYLSLDDFRQRTKVSKTVIDLMAELGLFGNLPQSNQLSLFDLV
ncbi:PolC-type DNA polymerase III [Faecalicatena contorta]|uniref:DNA polymerase III PolC-type n=1 Tax=Faecalicatena contorta TaxID=39482 RepID=A0A316A1G2_9FIRM|nr:PolC-type DNA polymerase III [Faecalicatena contorta]PWJ50900.1 DNA polymerase III catalytic subunit PolC type [Faecalicatena contorta]SUQ13468.1 DNA polymerase III catalytic subunit, PolC type [Faecalicatena contorta]